MTPPRILIVRLSAIGDVLHALPVLDALRRALPEARIGWLVEETSAPFLEGHPQLDTLYAIPRKRWRGRSFLRSFRGEVVPYFRRVRADGWDAALDLQGLAKSAMAARASGAPRRVAFAGALAREMSGLLATDRVAPGPEEAHVVRKNLALLRALGVEPPPDARGRLPLRPEERDKAAQSLRAAGWRGEPLAGLNLGAGWATKRWSPAAFAALGRLLRERHGLRPVVIWGPKEEAWRDECLAGLEGAEGFAAPPTTLRELAAVVSLLDLFVGGDTGPTHLAALLDVPTVAVFGASDPLRNGPWPPENAVVAARSGLACMPCWKTRCPLAEPEHLGCLRGLAPEAVADAAAEILARMARR
ncbi:MAG: glycosyltransferase family 9 protein [Candidatus Sumerlaeia bacterium]|nr:glycosyltransferase family 9 protein [Candidatus Sumerlaeia bacterium]